MVTHTDMLRVCDKLDTVVARARELCDGQLGSTRPMDPSDQQDRFVIGFIDLLWRMGW